MHQAPTRCSSSLNLSHHQTSPQCMMRQGRVPGTNILGSRKADPVVVANFVPTIPKQDAGQRREHDALSEDIRLLEGCPPQATDLKPEDRLFKDIFVNCSLAPRPSGYKREGNQLCCSVGFPSPAARVRQSVWRSGVMAACWASSSPSTCKSLCQNT